MTLASGTLAAAAAVAGWLFLGERDQEESAPLAARTQADTPVAPAGERIRVEVLNGAGRAGAASQATTQLRGRGFDVVYFGNAPGLRRDTSVVIDRSGNVAAAQAVAAVLGIASVASEPRAELYLDVTVILGRDWPRAVAPPEPRGSWTTRLRNWLR